MDLQQDSLVFCADIRSVMTSKNPVKQGKQSVKKRKHEAFIPSSYPTVRGLPHSFRTDGPTIPVYQILQRSLSVLAICSVGSLYPDVYSGEVCTPGVSRGRRQC